MFSIMVDSCNHGDSNCCFFNVSGILYHQTNSETGSESSFCNAMEKGDRKLKLIQKSHIRARARFRSSTGMLSLSETLAWKESNRESLSWKGSWSWAKFWINLNIPGNEPLLVCPELDFRNCPLEDPRWDKDLKLKGHTSNPNLFRKIFFMAYEMRRQFMLLRMTN